MVKRSGFIKERHSVRRGKAVWGVVRPRLSPFARVRFEAPSNNNTKIFRINDQVEYDDINGEVKNMRVLKKKRTIFNIWSDYR